MHTNYRAILPASTPLDPRISTGSEEERSPTARRVRARLACTRCRAKKISCDRKQPTCARCFTRRVTCEYDDSPNSTLKLQLERLRGDLKQHSDFVDRLRSAPETEVLEIVRRLRSTNKAASVLSSIHGAAHTSCRPSDLDTARAILPRSDSGLEFELNMLHQSVFPVLVPLDFETINPRQLFPASQDAFLSSLGISDKRDTNASLPMTGPPSPFRGIPPRRTSPIPGPVQDLQYCDSRLNRLNISYWTTVPISDQFAACILSNHFETYHAIFGCVDVDLFLSDLVNQKLNYCSPFLLASIMSFACQSYSTFDVRSSAFSATFMREAEKLRTAERTSDDPKNLAALCYLTMASTIYGDEQLRHQSAIETRDMATRMLLFGVQPTIDSAAAFHRLSADKIKELAHVAWGVYGALSFLGIYYMDPAIAYPPMLPVPGDARALVGSPELVWPAHPLPAYMGRTFQTFSSLWIIVQEINLVYMSIDQTPLTKRVSLAFAESKCQKLLAWADTLNADMRRGAHSTCHVYTFHGLFHCTILSLFRPFLESPEPLRLGSFSSLDATPSTIYSASLNQLKQLLVAYCTASPQLPPNVWFNSVALEIMNAMIRNLAHDSHWPFYLEVCFAFWKKAYVSYRTFYAVIRAILSLALESGVIGYNLATSMSHELRQAAPHYSTPEVAISKAILNFELALAREKQARLDNLAVQFDELVAIHDFTTLDEDKAD